MEWKLLAALDEPERDRVRQATRRRRFARGEVIFHEGDTGDTLHLIRSGRVAVRVATEHGDLATLSVLTDGDSFGELALVTERRQRTATVVALEPTETLTLTRAAFETLRRSNPGIDRLLVTLLADRVDELSHRLLETLYVGVDRRVARRLLELVAVYRGPSDSKVIVPLTQVDIADLVGASRPTVNQILQRLAGQGIIKLGRRRLELLDLDALRQRAGV